MLRYRFDTRFNRAQLIGGERQGVGGTTTLERLLGPTRHRQCATDAPGSSGGRRKLGRFSCSCCGQNSTEKASRGEESFFVRCVRLGTMVELKRPETCHPWLKSVDRFTNAISRSRYSKHPFSSASGLYVHRGSSFLEGRVVGRRREQIGDSLEHFVLQ